MFTNLKEIVERLTHHTLPSLEMPLQRAQATSRPPMQESRLQFPAHPVQAQNPRSLFLRHFCHCAHDTLPLRYQHRADDPKEIIVTPNPRLSAFTDMQRLIEEGMKISFEQLLRFCEEGFLQEGILLLHQKELFFSLYQLMTLELVSQSTLRSSPQNEKALWLNPHLSVHTSICCRFFTTRQAPALFFLNPSDWTPLTPSKEQKAGVDPVGLAIILSQLSQEERASLKLLALKALNAKDPSILEAERAMTEPMAIALLLIKDIALALQQKFHLSLVPLWETDFEKRLQRNETAVALLLEPPTEHISRSTWAPETLPHLSSLLPQLASSAQTLHELFAYSPNVVAVDEPTQRTSFETLREHYHLQEETDPFILILTALFSFPPSPEEVMQVKTLLAEWLPQQPQLILDDGHPFILNKTLNLATYIQWLKDPSTHPTYHSDELEIQLLSTFFGIQIGCFIPDALMHIRKDGLFWPVLRWGPHTQATILLYKEGSQRWFILTPHREEKEAVVEAAEENASVQANDSSADHLSAMSDFDMLEEDLSTMEKK